MKVFNLFCGLFLLVALVWFVHDMNGYQTKGVSKKHATEAEMIEGLKIFQARHIVSKGDTLFDLAEKYGVHISDIKKANNIPKKKDILSLGQELWIPESGLEPLVGIASWYGPNFHGKPMANGRVYDQDDPNTVAHPDWPLGTKVLVINLETQKTAFAVVRDRGSFREKYGRLIDCSVALAKELDFYKQGTAKVRIVPL